MEKCTNCNGFGHTDRDGFRKCQLCNGSGTEVPNKSEQELKSDLSEASELIKNLLDDINGNGLSFLSSFKEAQNWIDGQQKNIPLTYEYKQGQPKT